MLFEIVVFAVALFVIEILLYNEKFLGAIVPVIGLVAFSIFYLQFNFLTFLYYHSSEVVMYAVGYLIVGVILSMFKWKEYTREYYENKLKYIKSHGVISSYKFDNSKIDDLVKRDYIVGHITWWPFVLLVDICHKPFELAFRYLSTVYDKIENYESVKYTENISRLAKEKDEKLSKTK